MGITVRTLSEANLILCADESMSLHLTCNYPDNNNVEFTRRFYDTEVRVTLLTWPGKELIAESTLSAESRSDCPLMIDHLSSVKSDKAYAQVDVIGWVEQYVTITP
jgi:hypothetical protein